MEKNNSAESYEKWPRNIQELDPKNCRPLSLQLMSVCRNRIHVRIVRWNETLLSKGNFVPRLSCDNVPKVWDAGQNTAFHSQNPVRTVKHDGGSMMAWRRFDASVNRHFRRVGIFMCIYEKCKAEAET